MRRIIRGSCTGGDPRRPSSAQLPPQGTKGTFPNPDGDGMCKYDNRGNDICWASTAAYTVKQFVKRCEDVTKDFDEAEIGYNANPTMRLNRTEDFTVTIAPPRTMPSAPTGQFGSQGTLLVTCTVEARLHVDPQELRVPATGWEEQRYVPSTPAEWSWPVTPLVAGEIPGEIELRPVVVIKKDGKTTETSYTTASYKFTIDSQAGFMDRVRSATQTLNDLNAFVKAAVLLLVGVGIKIWGPPVWRRIRRSKSTDPTGPTSDQDDAAAG